MAEGTIISIAKSLGVLILEEYNFLQGVQEQVVSLSDELQWISSFLGDAAMQGKKNERVDVWLSQIRDLAYDAEDVIDTFILTVKLLRERNIKGLISYPCRLNTLHKLGKQINSINRRIERISSYKSKYAINTLENKEPLANDVELNERRAIDVEEDDVVGFLEQSTVVTMKLEKADPSQILVVSIVGMHGAGKSTLARMVYNDFKNEDKFDSYAWIDVFKKSSINVSQEFKSETLRESILEQNPTKEDMGMGKLLVVFDDVRRRQDWDVILHNVLEKIKCTNFTVLLTSHSREVATHANPYIEPYNIEKLSIEEGLDLLKKKVFHKNDYPEELKEIAEKLVEKCKGLPLAIVVLGGLLSRKPKTHYVWNKVLRNVHEQIIQGSTEWRAIITLSYDNLPNFLKPCFLYLGLFPEDWSIDCEEIIQLWIAEGFIQERGEETMEEIAEDYFEELIRRNIIQVEERRSNGSAKLCRIHGLLREFAISKGRQEKFIGVRGSKSSVTHVMSRRFAVLETAIPDSSSLNNPRSNHPRSMLCFKKLNNIRLLAEDKSFHKTFKLLRVLDLRGATDLQSLSDEIGKLVLLKYLNLRGALGIKSLPSSICNLRNLQTLDICDTGIDGIPWSVWELEELRHFYANLSSSGDSNSSDSCNLLLRRRWKNKNIKRPRNLRTLSARGGNWIGEDDFSQFINLRKLRLFDVDIDCYGKALSGSICKFIYLRELYISWQNKGKLHFPNSLSQHVHLYRVRLEGVMESLNAFPPFLTELELFETELRQEGDSIKALATLENLKFLKLGERSFLGKQMVFPAKGFRKLINLFIWLEDLEEWEVEEGSLMNLKVLQLSSLKSLKELPDGLRLVKNLRSITLLDMPPEFKARVARDEGDDWDKIKHIPTIKVS